jgi:hypothetical protein
VSVVIQVCVSVSILVGDGTAWSCASRGIGASVLRSYIVEFVGNSVEISDYIWVCVVGVSDSNFTENDIVIVLVLAVIT